MLLIGSILDQRYEILKQIGRGGMSVVYLAMNNRLNKSLAVKEIRKSSSQSSQLLIDSLLAEANMLKKLDHPALPKIYDIIESDGNIYVVMDYVEGETLKEKLDREGPQTSEDVIVWAQQLSDVLGYLHSRKPNPIIYRDMKPANIMLTPEGKIKLIDFGIAREHKPESTSDTTNLGTKEYAAPEQIAGKQTDARTDIYSLGVTLYHLVTGKCLNEPPYELLPIRHWNPNLSEGLEHIISTCTQAHPENRYNNCFELSYELANVDKLTKSYKVGLVKQLVRFIACLVALVLCLGVSLIGYFKHSQRVFSVYQDYLGHASADLMDGKDAQAIAQLEQAIRLDGTQAQAYIDLLDLYVSRNEVDQGLSKLENYMNNNSGLQNNDELMFKLARVYFDVKKDYTSAKKYFGKVDVKRIKDAEYYRSFSDTMSSMNINYKKFYNDLEQFKQFNDGLADDENKIANYNSLANVYISYKAQIPNANTKTIAVIERAQKIMDSLNDPKLEFKYNVDFEEKLAQAFYSRGIETKTQTDLAKAVEHYQKILKLDVPDSKREECILSVGSIYQEMWDNQKAIEQYKDAISKYPQSLMPYVKLANLYLDIEQSKPQDGRNYSPAKDLYLKASTISGALDNEAFKKLKKRLSNLQLI